MSKRLLLADDSITIQKVIQITFAHEDYELTITDNGDTAYARARELAPHLVLADVYMPGKNGYELCAAIKQDPALRQVPVLLLAGSFEPFDEGKARAAGADAWIEKPFESQALIDKVAQMLSAAPAVAPTPAPAPVVAPAPPAPPVAVVSDPFADICFEETAAAAVPPPQAAAPADQWGELNLELEGASAPPAEFAFAEPAAAPPVFEFDSPVFADAAPAQPPVDFDAFAESDEIMTLGDDDILGAEDLEPVSETATLTPWSRTDFSVEDTFGELAEPEPLAALEPVSAAPPPVTPVPQPVAPPVAVAPVVAAPPPPPPPVVEVAAPVAETVVAQRAATLTETEIEQIVERAVGKVIERLAGTILERVAWEVVPDLAEALIKEEIRKIKDAAA